jgi:hypothetical protein
MNLWSASTVVIKADPTLRHSSFTPREPCLCQRVSVAKWTFLPRRLLGISRAASTRVISFSLLRSITSMTPKGNDCKAVLDSEREDGPRESSDVQRPRCRLWLNYNAAFHEPELSDHRYARGLFCRQALVQALAVCQSCTAGRLATSNPAVCAAGAAVGPACVWLVAVNASDWRSLWTIASGCPGKKSFAIRNGAKSEFRNSGTGLSQPTTCTVFCTGIGIGVLCFFTVFRSRS